jgi:hypothetical protein
MTKGQQAMAHAMIYPDAEKGGRGKKKNSSETEGFSGTRLSMARTVLANAPDLARGVLVGSEHLDKAYETVRRRERPERLRAPGHRLTVPCVERDSASP